jgi:hypothetical protein
METIFIMALIATLLPIDSDAGLIYVYDVWASENGEIFSVGEGGVQHYNGYDWELLLSTQYIITSVWVSPQNEIFIGDDLGLSGAEDCVDPYIGGFYSALFKFNGNDWESIQPYNLDDFECVVPNSIWGTSSDSVF